MSEIARIPSGVGQGSDLPSPYTARKIIGGILWFIGMAVGLILIVILFIVEPRYSERPLDMALSMAVGAVLAFPAAAMYLTFPRLLDRFDPEPLYALTLALLWGAIAACGIAAWTNTIVGGIMSVMFGERAGELFTVVVSAPFVEEGLKGVMVLGIAYFLRDEFDGIVDGIIYATFVAIGFAATENVLYYGRSLYAEGMSGLKVVVFLRGVLAPWGHPLYTAMTGIGLGLARERTSLLPKLAFPVLGYIAAVLLHMLWNGSGKVCDALFGEYGIVVWFAQLLLWLVFVLAFITMVILLVRRRGAIIRKHLVDEVALGHVTTAELELVTSVFGTVKALWRKGLKGQEFLRAVARLGLTKWHTSRAMAGNAMTVSMDYILPLRARIKELRAQGASPT